MVIQENYKCSFFYLKFKIYIMKEFLKSLWFVIKICIIADVVILVGGLTILYLNDTMNQFECSAVQAHVPTLFAVCTIPFLGVFLGLLLLLIFALVGNIIIFLNDKFNINKKASDLISDNTSEKFEELVDKCLNNKYIKYLVYFISYCLFWLIIIAIINVLYELVMFLIHLLTDQLC